MNRATRVPLQIDSMAAYSFSVSVFPGVLNDIKLFARGSVVVKVLVQK